MRNQGILPEVDIKKKIPEVERMGFVEALKGSDTGIGFTYETLLGIPENNRKGPDFTYLGDEVELKTQRRGTSANLTLFTKEPSIRDIKDVPLMQKYGYQDKSGRLGLKPDCMFGQFNPQNLSLTINEDDSISLIDKEGYKPWTWIPEDISSKFNFLLLAFADSKKENKKEYFHFNEAYYLKNFEKKKFLELIKNKKIVINLRMHQKTSGGSRNHGTGFRINSIEDWMKCYKKKEKII